MDTVNGPNFTGFTVTDLNIKIDYELLIDFQHSGRLFQDVLILIQNYKHGNYVQH